MKTIEGRAFVDGEIRDDVRITVDDDVIADVDSGARSSAGLGEGLLVPGFVDLHVHGGDGADFMDADEEAARRICAVHAQHGTTSLAATTLSGSRQHISAAVQTARAVAAQGGNGARIAAIHLEGPYIDADHAGAQDRASIREASPRELTEWLEAAGDLPLLMTIAPETRGAMALIRSFRDRIRFSIGHTAADYATAAAAIGAGVVHATHLFNAMPGLHHRHPGVIGAIATHPDVTAELIADGHHLHPSVLRMAAMLLRDRAVLVTDAMRACGREEGTWRLYEHEVQVRDGAARLKDGTLAGSVLTMARAVCNMVELAAVPLEMVIPMASAVPARALGLDCGRIARGKRADLVLLGPRWEVRRVWVAGREIS